MLRLTAAWRCCGMPSTMSNMDSDGESDLEDRWAEVGQALDEELPFGAGAPQAEEDGEYFFILTTVAPGGNLFQESCLPSSSPLRGLLQRAHTSVMQWSSICCGNRALWTAGYQGGRLRAREVSAGPRVDGCERPGRLGLPAALLRLPGGGNP